MTHDGTDELVKDFQIDKCLNGWKQIRIKQSLRESKISPLWMWDIAPRLSPRSYSEQWCLIERKLFEPDV